MGCLFRLLFLLIVAAVIGIPGAAVLMGVEQKPLLDVRTGTAATDLRQAAALALRFGPAATQPGRATTITLSEPELNLLIRSWTARVPQVTARAGVAPIGVGIGATAALPVPENPLGRYINVRALVVPSNSGLDIEKLSVGRIDVPTPFIRPLLVFLLDHFGGSGQGDMLYATVRGVRIAGQRVAITMVVPPGFVAGLAGGGALPSTGNAAIDALLRRATPAERQRVMDAVQRRLGSDPAAAQRVLESIRQRFGGKLPPVDDKTIEQLRQQYGGDLPTDPAAAEAEIRRRLANDPAARQRAIDELRRRGVAPTGR
jgi:hypothetical protein